MSFSSSLTLSGDLNPLQTPPASRMRHSLRSSGGTRTSHEKGKWWGPLPWSRKSVLSSEPVADPLLSTVLILLSHLWIGREHTCMPRHACGAQRTTCVVGFSIDHADLRHWTWAFRLDSWPSSPLESCPSLCNQCWNSYRYVLPCLAFTQVWEIETGSSYLHSKHSPYWAISPAPSLMVWMLDSQLISPCWEGLETLSSGH